MQLSHQWWKIGLIKINKDRVKSNLLHINRGLDLDLSQPAVSMELKTNM